MKNKLDTREKLYADIDHWLGSWTALSVPTSTIKEAILGWLGRMAGIVEHECVDTRVNFAERIRLYQKGREDGQHARGAASFPQHHEDDSREKLEADVLKYYTHTTSTLMWPDEANIKTKWVSVSMDTVLGWLDRQVAITRLECSEEHRTRLGELHDLLDEAASERELLRAELLEYKHSHPDAPNQPTSQFDAPKSGETAGINASKDDMGDFDDSREMLEADVRAGLLDVGGMYCVQGPRTVLGWLDRAADIREREFVQQYCAECETAENAALKGDIEVLRNRLDKLQAENDALTAAHADDVERLDAMGEGELQKQVDELQAEVEDAQDELKREWKEAEKWKARCAELQAELEARVRYPDGFVSIADMTERVGKLESENIELKAERDSLEHDLSETEAKFAKEMAETLSLHSKQQAASHQAWVDAVDERDYWKQEVQYCMDAAYPPSHAPERPYNPHVMDYPPSGAYTTPATMVSAVIDGLRDEKADEWMGVLKQLKETQAERDRYRELASELLDAAHNMQLIADRGLA